LELYDSDDIEDQKLQMACFVDFLSATMLIFILIASIIVFALYKKTIVEEILNKKNKNLLKNTEHLSVKVADHKSEILSLSKLNEIYKNTINSLSIELEKLKGKKIIIPNELREKVFFDSGKATIREEFIPILERHFVEIKKLLDNGTYNYVQIEGHTDDVPIYAASFFDNWELGAERAIAVARFFEKKGLSAKCLSAATHSKYKPLHEISSLDVDEDLQNIHLLRSKNRRIEITLFKK